MSTLLPPIDKLARTHMSSILSNGMGVGKTRQESSPLVTLCAFWCTTVFMARRRSIYKMSFSLLCSCGASNTPLGDGSLHGCCTTRHQLLVTSHISQDLRTNQTINYVKRPCTSEGCLPTTL